MEPDNVVTFRPRATAPHVPPAEARRMIEQAAQAALDTADGLLAILDHMGGDTDHEDGAGAEPSLAALESFSGQVVWLRRNDACREAEAPETALPVVISERTL